MKKWIFSGLLFLICISSYSQNLDLVVTATGDSIVCKIDSVSESQIYFQVKDVNNKWTSAMQNIVEINDYKYDYIKPKDINLSPDTSQILIEVNNNIKYLKKKYPIKDYEYSKSDTYNPDKAFALSLIPLAAHFYVHEPLRGFMFLGASGISWFSLAYGLSLPFLDEPLGAYLIAIGAVGVPLFFFWRMVDVGKIAKVKNLAFRDKAISVNVIPNLEINNQLIHTNTFGVVITLKF